MGTDCISEEDFISYILYCIFIITSDKKIYPFTLRHSNISSALH